MIYRHCCGQRYHRTTAAMRPRHCMVICERCLEPMPVCDDARAAFAYEAIHVFPPKRLATADVPGTLRPALKTNSITPLFALSGNRQSGTDQAA